MTEKHYFSSKYPELDGTPMHLTDQCLIELLAEEKVDADDFVSWVANDWNESCLQNALGPEDEEGTHYAEAYNLINLGWTVSWGELKEMVSEFKAGGAA
tara:strand:+ start:41 stop:337 length:297 start_codon:yes stop_codon:yes gene_type:complete